MYMGGGAFIGCFAAFFSAEFCILSLNCRLYKVPSS